jgi:hypothetical protein
MDYRKYLDEAEPTELMKHLASWLQEKAGIDPTKEFRTKGDAFAAGVYLTVHLRNAHQASEENQTRLAEVRETTLAAEAAKQERRALREAAGAKPYGRLPKALKEQAEAPTAKETKPAPKKRATAKPKVAAPEFEKPARRPRKAAPAKPAPTNETKDTATPERRRRAPRAKAAAPAPAPEAQVVSIEERRASAATAGTTPRRRRTAPRRSAPKSGEAAF